MTETIYTTQQGVHILVSQGIKSLFDFKVQYQEPGRRVRTPKHIHIIIDLYMKRSGDEALTMLIADRIISITKNVRALESYPPKLQLFKPSHVAEFAGLNCYGEYTVDFLLVVVELIMIQEKTNYPTGTMNLRLFEKFRQGGDIFSVVSAATFR